MIKPDLANHVRVYTGRLFYDGSYTDEQRWVKAEAFEALRSRFATEPTDDDASLRRDCVDLAAANAVSVAGCAGWPSSALLAFKLLCQRNALNRGGNSNG